MALPYLTVARRLHEIVTKVTNLETVKIEFCHLRFLLSIIQKKAIATPRGVLSDEADDSYSSDKDE